MQNIFKSLVATSTVLLAATAMAAPVSLGSVEHLYGSSAGRQAPSISAIFHPGGNCDTLNADSITVKATSASTCNRFGDIFDFSGISYDSIDSFALTLNFSGARNQLFGLERWSVRGSSNYVETPNTNSTALNAGGTQTFTFTSAMSLFNSIVSAQDFMVSFTTNSGAASTFDLTSARLELFGTPTVAEVSEPASLALVGLSLIALGGVRRARRKTAA